MAEEWRPVPGYEGLYEVSDEGRVRSWHTKRGRILVGSINVWGYRVAALTRHPDPMFYARVHQLVALAFIGPCPPGQMVRHLDGDQLNNSPTNLAYGTHSDNARDSVRHGTQWQVAKTHCPQGHPYDEANTYHQKVKPGRVCRICRNEWVRLWKLQHAV